jgi:hypothetical protein
MSGKLSDAAVEGFKGSFKLAGALMEGVVKAPIKVIDAFVHEGVTRSTSQKEKSHEQRGRNSRLQSR